jgi:hypothetical protein
MSYTNLEHQTSTKNSMQEHLEARGVLPMHNVVVDEETRTATFFLNAYGTGKFLGFQTYKPEGPKTAEGKGFDRRDLRYFTHAVDGELPYFGAESFHFHNQFMFLVEGIFDAVKFHALRLPCCAVLANNPIRLQSFLTAMNRIIIGFCDNDKAGLSLAGSCDMFFIAPEKDAGDMTSKELMEFLFSKPMYHFVDGEICEIAPACDFRYAL